MSTNDPFTKRKSCVNDGDIPRRRKIMGLSKLRPLCKRPIKIPKNPLLNVDCFFVGLMQFS